MSRADRRRRRRLDGDWRAAVAAIVGDIERVRDPAHHVGAVVLAVLSVPPAGGAATWLVSHGVHHRLAATSAGVITDAADAVTREAAALRAQRAGHLDA